MLNMKAIGWQKNMVASKNRGPDGNKNLMVTLSGLLKSRAFTDASETSDDKLIAGSVLQVVSGSFQ